MRTSVHCFIEASEAIKRSGKTNNNTHARDRSMGRKGNRRLPLLLFPVRPLLSLQQCTACDDSKTGDVFIPLPAASRGAGSEATDLWSEELIVDVLGRDAARL